MKKPTPAIIKIYAVDMAYKFAESPSDLKKRLMELYERGTIDGLEVSRLIKLSNLEDA